MTGQADATYVIQVGVEITQNGQLVVARDTVQE
jgi:hypothetical protein